MGWCVTDVAILVIVFKYVVLVKTFLSVDSSGCGMVNILLSEQYSS